MNLEKKQIEYKEASLQSLWIRFKDIEPLLKSLSDNVFHKTICGYSENGIPIYQISIGTGVKTILFWSQMHGDESTATKVLFDSFNFLQAEYQTNKHLKQLLQAYTLVFIPMLNPDGALAYTRENAQNKDINRDAISLKTQGGQVLDRLITTLKPDFAFNLHDQDSFYNVKGTDKVATFSFLAPAADVEKTLTNTRKQALSVIYAMYQAMQKFLPNHIGRYKDTYCETCFGDQIQKRGIPTILIESGHYPNDEAREMTRKFHFIALISALFKIASKNLPDYKGYFTIPANEKLFYDIRYDNVIYNNKNTSIAIRYNDFVRGGKLIKIILKEQILIGEQLKGKYFHKIIDCKGKEFSTIQLD